MRSAAIFINKKGIGYIFVILALFGECERKLTRKIPAALTLLILITRENHPPDITHFAIVKGRIILLYPLLHILPQILVATSRKIDLNTILEFPLRSSKRIALCRQHPNSSAIRLPCSLVPTVEKSVTKLNKKNNSTNISQYCHFYQPDTTRNYWYIAPRTTPLKASLHFHKWQEVQSFPLCDSLCRNTY